MMSVLTEGCLVRFKDVDVSNTSWTGIVLKCFTDLNARGKKQVCVYWKDSIIWTHEAEDLIECIG